MTAEAHGRVTPSGQPSSLVVSDEGEMFIVEAGETLPHPVEQAADVVVRQSRSGTADEDEGEVESRRFLDELRQFGCGDPIIVVLRENDRVRSIEVAVDVPHGRARAPQGFDHPQIIGPVGAVPAERLRNEVIVVGRRDPVPCGGNLFDRLKDFRVHRLQGAKLSNEKRAIGSASGPAKLLLDHVRGGEPVCDWASEIKSASSHCRRPRAEFHIPPPSFAASAKASLMNCSHPGACPSVAARGTPRRRIAISARPSVMASQRSFRGDVGHSLGSRKEPVTN